MTATDITVWQLSVADLEWVGPVTVAVNGVPVSVFDLAVVDAYDAAAVPAWLTPRVLSGGQGLLIGATGDVVLARGDYWLQARFLASPEHPVLTRVGLIIVA